MSEDQVRICVVGDELVAGLGDARGLGWVGRVTARTRTETPMLVAPLAVPDETSTALAARWETECARRFGRHTTNRLVVGLGATDLREGLSLARSRLNLANILDAARSARIECFVVGPPPRPDVDPDALGSLSQAFADVSSRRQVPYVETFAPLRTHDQWHADVAAGDGTHPGQAGYGLLAWLVLHNGWHEWLGVAQD
ncbi:GDSL-type esterase/lipase family protein [Georgenia faecalis]|uniref:GDSL-type esterase/lipase family protein n=1 Tax=Georgenia faecalis TaxID=2483799 RepID=A0ABV9DB29_9MICO|nr:GDSL-type esterase/lipase family protein [Georgenia faecalis]